MCDVPPLGKSFPFCAIFLFFREPVFPLLPASSANRPPDFFFLAISLRFLISLPEEKGENFAKSLFAGEGLPSLQPSPFGTNPQFLSPPMKRWVGPDVAELPFPDRSVPSLFRCVVAVFFPLSIAPDESHPRDLLSLRNLLLPFYSD